MPKVFCLVGRLQMTIFMRGRHGSARGFCTTARLGWGTRMAVHVRCCSIHSRGHKHLPVRRGIFPGAAGGQGTLGRVLTQPGRGCVPCDRDGGQTFHGRVSVGMLGRRQGVLIKAVREEQLGLVHWWRGEPRGVPGQDW